MQEWFQSDTYNLYQSDPPGVYYSLVLEEVRSTHPPEENVLIDILEVRDESRWVDGGMVHDGWVDTDRLLPYWLAACIHSES